MSQELDPKLVKRVDQLYRNCKQMPLLCGLSLFVPIVMPFVVPLCLVYAGQRRGLLKELSGVDLRRSGSESPAKGPSTAEQVSFLRQNGARFYAPIAIAVAVIAIVALIVYGQ